MSQQLQELKTDFVSSIQTNQYEKAMALIKQIIELDPQDMVVQRFSSFMDKHSEITNDVNIYEIPHTTTGTESEDDNTLEQQDCGKDTSQSSSIQPKEHNFCELRGRQDSILDNFQVKRQKRATYCAPKKEIEKSWD